MTDGEKLSLKARGFLLDAGVLALYLAGDDRAREYFEGIMAGRASGFVSDVNLAEFYYKTAQKLGEETAEARTGLLASSRITLMSTDVEIAKAAGRWKLRAPRLSLTDCFALASLEKEAEVLLTTDAELKRAARGRAVLFDLPP